MRPNNETPSICGSLSRFAFTPRITPSSASTLVPSQTSVRCKRKMSSRPIQKRPAPRKRSTLTQVKSLDPIVCKGVDVHTLILGTIPSAKSRGVGLTTNDIHLRGGSGNQNYGNSRNCFFNIVGSALGWRRDQTPYEEQCSSLTSAGFALWDVLGSCDTLGSLDSQIISSSQRTNDIPKFVQKHKQLRRIVFTGNSYKIFAKRSHFGQWLRLGHHSGMHTHFLVRKGLSSTSRTWAQFQSASGRVKKGFDAVHLIDGEAYARTRWGGDVRPLELVVMPSTSPAAATMRPPEKEELWHRGCFRFVRPPSSYICPGCGNQGRRTSHGVQHSSGQALCHWFSQCPLKVAWLEDNCKDTRRSREECGTSWYR